VVVDDVFAVNVEVCAVLELNVSELDERLQVAGLGALVGVLVTEQASETVPVNELPGVTVMVEVPLAPGATDMVLGLLESVKLLLLGASQNPLHPDSAPASSVAVSNRPAPLPILIAAPLQLPAETPCDLRKR
jgi:hypothetical protein